MKLQRKRWTEKELIILASDQPPHVIAKQLVGRTLAAIHSKRQHMSLADRIISRKWTKAEAAYALKHYAAYGPSLIAFELGRNATSVANWAHEAGVRYKRRAPSSLRVKAAIAQAAFEETTGEKIEHFRGEKNET